MGAAAGVHQYFSGNDMYTSPLKILAVNCQSVLETALIQAVAETYEAPCIWFIKVPCNI